MENKVNPISNTITRKALMVDEDKDRYRRKERNDMLKQAGYKVYPVLRMQDACTRCKPGAFDVIVVNGTLNPGAAMELSEQIKANDPKQMIILVSNENHDKDYVVGNWDELSRRISGEGEQKKDNLAAA